MRPGLRTKTGVGYEKTLGLEKPIRPLSSTALNFSDGVYAKGFTIRETDSNHNSITC